MKIPKIIHQTWKDNAIPQSMKELSDTWKTHHPTWEYYLWTDKKNREFVKLNFPEFLKIYDGFEANIQRADAIRYLILYKIGGIYVDMDFECFRSLEPLLGDSLCVFSKEPREHCLMHGMDVVICNAFMASIPEHPFMDLLIKEIAMPVLNYENSNTRVMNSTGPYMVTRVYKRYMPNDNLTILEPDFVYPLTRNEVLSMLTESECDPKAQERLDNSVAVHYWLNTWVNFKATL